MKAWQNVNKSLKTLRSLSLTAQRKIELEEMNILATILPEVIYKIGNFPMNSMIKLKVFSGNIFKVSPGFFKLPMYNVKREE